MLPVAVKPNEIFTFNIEVPYYNWFYPLQYGENDRITFSPRSIPLNEVKGVYIHFPFCSSLCSFCPFIRTNIHDASLRNRYVQHLTCEIKSYQRQEKPEIRCIFFGGGSPSLMSPNNFSEIMEAIKTVFRISSGCEICVETNAMSLKPELCSVFYDYNVSKVRIGVQSFDPRSRELYQLRATVDDVIYSTKLAHSYGLQVSFDLLFGHHGQSLETFLLDIEKADKLNPDTIEIYPINLLAVPDRYWNSVLFFGLKGLNARTRIEYFKVGRDRLLELGYYQWSGHGFSCSPEFDLIYHRCVYGTLGGIIGFGPGAVSFNSDYVKWNNPSIDRYMNDMQKQHMPTFKIRRVFDYERLSKKIVIELPYYGSCNIANLKLIPEISSKLSELISAGVIQRNSSDLVLSNTARLQYATLMFYLLPKKDKDALGQEIFSHCARLGNKFRADMLWL